MPIYRASAPFSEGDKGDRRVTGFSVRLRTQAQNRGRVSALLVRLNSLYIGQMVLVGRRQTGKFSREFERLVRVNGWFSGSKRTNSRENLTARGRDGHVKWRYSSTFRGSKRAGAQPPFWSLSGLCTQTPVTLLSPLPPSEKGANALYIGILSP